MVELFEGVVCLLCSKDVQRGLYLHGTRKFFPLVGVLPLR